MILLLGSAGAFQLICIDSGIKCNKNNVCKGIFLLLFSPVNPPTFCSYCKSEWKACVCLKKTDKEIFGIETGSENDANASVCKKEFFLKKNTPPWWQFLPDLEKLDCLGSQHMDAAWPCPPVSWPSRGHVRWALGNSFWRATLNLPSWPPWNSGALIPSRYPSEGR